MATPCYSARFVQPFAAVLSNNERYTRGSLEKLRAIDPSSRLPIHAAHSLVIDQVAQTEDEDLGIKAARVAGLGRGGALDYAMHSAATVRSAIEVGARYTRLFSDSLRVLLDFRGPRAIVRLGTTIPAPRAVPDFATAYWYLNHTRTPLGTAAKLECFFEHEKPVNTDEYDRTYGDPAELHFDAGFYGFAFDREYLDAPLSTSDPSVHAVLCEHLALAAARLDDNPTLSSRVREMAMQDLEGGALSATRIARRLRMSTRTLSSRLEREGTTFTMIVDGLRRELAIAYVGHPEISHTEIAYRLGFAHVEAFYRAFKRWTQTSPGSYRRERASGAPPPAFPDRRRRFTTSS
ncbi:MAG TPA: AraC family transcriptional regulator ligand-binding domain-containing protein [Polyangiaceae bacterium]|nr:AraC family transcriptional regulator ligand-binding domain-containing protein [Polyangiaceae bacterium]